MSGGLLGKCLGMCWGYLRDMLAGFYGPEVRTETTMEQIFQDPFKQVLKNIFFEGCPWGLFGGCYLGIC